ncbi:PEP-CTERM sorting domain-containing protein [Sphingomonas panacisoli]|uniref:PEP-CTERM sorting domain-containing protein n=2 Tax=Sphingomonas panacisoli TaxID=1813879 RepID=A0A5B8LLM2_9SPHN|nr:PEP-CTERM sorting domain-containing protein [Sphingomonas panacisoli]
MLQFSRAVQLTSATLNVYGIGNSSDSDAAIYNLGALIGPQPSWNGAINLNGATNDTSIWTAADGQGSRTAMLNTSSFSQVWLISAAQLPANDRDDGFKLGQLVVNAAPQVPEPATWAMLIMGFGAIGASLRRRAAATTAALA